MPILLNRIHLLIKLTFVWSGRSQNTCKLGDLHILPDELTFTFEWPDLSSFIGYLQGNFSLAQSTFAFVALIFCLTRGFGAKILVDVVLCLLQAWETFKVIFSFFTFWGKKCYSRTNKHAPLKRPFICLDGWIDRRGLCLSEVIITNSSPAKGLKNWSCW